MPLANNKIAFCSSSEKKVSFVVAFCECQTVIVLLLLFVQTHKWFAWMLAYYLCIRIRCVHKLFAIFLPESKMLTVMRWFCIHVWKIICLQFVKMFIVKTEKKKLNHQNHGFFVAFYRYSWIQHVLRPESCARFFRTLHFNWLIPVIE